MPDPVPQRALPLGKEAGRPRFERETVPGSTAFEVGNEIDLNTAKRFFVAGLYAGVESP